MNNINKISFCNGEKIINTNTGKYIIKEGNNSNIYNYLRSRGFNNFLDVEKSINNNEIYLYRNECLYTCEHLVKDEFVYYLFK